MKLPEVVELLGEEVPQHINWVVAILTRRNRDGTASNEVLRHPIYEVSVDHDDSEINLITDEDADDGRLVAQALILGELLSQLKRLMSECSSYSVFSGSAFVSLDDEYEARYDAPLVGVARNSEAEVYGFLQFPPEQWETTD
jgi:hypothetical protein